MAVMIVTNTWDIIMGVFDLAQSVVNNAAGIISADTAIDITQVVGNLEARLNEMEIGPLLGLWFQTLFVGVTIQALSICIFVIIYPAIRRQIPQGHGTLSDHDHQAG